MNNNTTYYGTLEKSETLQSIQIANSTNKHIYESRSPFWGYYDDYPGIHNDPKYLYFLIDAPLSFIEVHRILQKAEQELEISVDMAHAALLIKDRVYYAIRARNFGDINNIPTIENKLIELGIQFHQNKEDFNNATSATRITKYFCLNDVEDGVWRDVKADNFAYIELSERIDLEQFKELIRNIKNNWQKHSFDAALGALASPKKVTEIIRIYSKHLDDAGYLTDIKKALHSVI